MSWSIEITTNKDIIEEDINNIVNNLPIEYQGSLCYGKQSWGWPTCIDISIPKGKHLGLHGAGYSRHISDEMAQYLKQELTTKGYKTTVSKRYD